MSEQFFPYGQQEMAYLKSRDARLGEVIDRVGWVARPIIPDLFAALVHSIVGQQISTKAHASIWRKIQDGLGMVSPDAVLRLSPEELQAFGLSFRKVEYIRQAAEKIFSGEFDIQALRAMDDAAVCTRLSELNGIGTWTAEMLMLHALLRPNILSGGDLGIQRGLCMLHHHRRLTPALLHKYQRLYSPYGSVASIYLWAISSGEVEGVEFYEPPSPSKRPKKYRQAQSRSY
jgi:DNA-3-methyladenine glycosylase II